MLVACAPLCQTFVSNMIGFSANQLFPPGGLTYPMTQTFFDVNIDVTQPVNAVVEPVAPISFSLLQMGLLIPLAYQMHKVRQPFAHPVQSKLAPSPWDLTPVCGCDERSLPFRRPSVCKALRPLASVRA